MNRPAVPGYVEKAANGYADCPPGHRFNLYFPIWKENWEPDKNGKAAALRQGLRLGSAKPALEGVLKRQQTLVASLPEQWRFTLEARSTSPFATGLGLEHPVENGFAFLAPYGLPYLAGSGVKGVLRRAAEELEADGKLPAGAALALFGHEDANHARRGALTCWDVFPEPANDKLVVEIMTPHQGDYYRGEATPHDSGKPVPVPFLAVPDGSRFRFILICDPAMLTDAVPAEAWQGQVTAILTHAFDWLGFGAKTAVGYGALEEDPEVRRERERIEQERRERDEQEREQRRLEALSPEDLAWERHEPEIDAFRDLFQSARKGRYQPGSLFDSKRSDFMKTALSWDDARSRQAAGGALKETMNKEWGMPSKTETKQRIKAAIDQLTATP